MNVEAQIEENFRRAEASTNIREAMQTRIDALENNSSSSSRESHNGIEQNSVRAVATSCTESFTEEVGVSYKT